MPNPKSFLKKSFQMGLLSMSEFKKKSTFTDVKIKI